uniref:FAD/NAD(P)-binding domain-containing protein n=1 Tax=Clastoptera arizonana TaxID=38151 RepID=A0A1B6DIK6_9HEMI
MVMIRHLKYFCSYNLGIKPKQKITIRENQILPRFYTSKNHSTSFGQEKPEGITKLMTECNPKNSSEIHISSQANKGRTIYPTELKQQNKSMPNESSKRPSIVDSCNVVGQSGKPDSEGNGNGNKQRNYKLLFFMGALITTGSLYYAWKTNLIGSNDNPEDKSKETKKTDMKKKKKDRWPVLPQKVPSNSSDIPDNVPYLLIGGGTASFAAFRAIKSSDPKAQILVIGNEPFLPYMRPPLSKEMWYGEDRQTIDKLVFKQWNGTERSLFYEPPEFYTDCKDLITSKNGGVSIVRGWNISKINVNKRVAYLEDGKEIHYDKCLIATGAVPKKLPLLEQASNEVKKKVSLFRDIYSFEKLEDLITDGVKSIAVIGGGFLGSELACALARRGKQEIKVYQVFKESGNMAKILPAYLCKWTTEKVIQEGVEVFANAEVEDIKLVNNQISLVLSNGKNVQADHVVVAIGVKPNTSLADSESGLEVDPDLGGYLVNAELEARSNLYVAGDCACFYDVKLGRRRVEHHDHAVVSGRLAGENMTGAAKPYLHQSMLWSDLGPDVGYEAIGLVDSTFDTVGVYAKVDTNENESSSNSENYNKGVIFYLRDEIIVGIVLWNVFNKMNIARQVLKENKKYGDLNEVAKLFNIHEK